MARTPEHATVCPQYYGIFGVLTSTTKYVKVSHQIRTSVQYFTKQLCVFSVDEWYARIPMLVLYHIFFGLFICSYWKTVFTNAGVVPQR